MPVVTPADLTSPQLIAPTIQATPTNPIPKQDIPIGEERVATSESPHVERRPSPELAQLARRERAIRQQARAVQAERQAFQSKQQEIEKQAQDNFRQKLLTNPWDTMIEAGLSPDQATELILNKPQPHDLELKNLRRELEALKTDSKAQIDKQVDDQYQEAKRHMAMEANLLVKRDETFEPIRAMGATAAIPTLIEDVFHKGLPGKYPKGYIMSIEEAASMVNEHVIDEGVKMAKMRAVADRLGRQSPQAAAQKPYSESKPQNNTLSNRMTASTQTSSSDRERRERAILAYQGKL